MLRSIFELVKNFVSAVISIIQFILLITEVRYVGIITINRTKLTTKLITN